MCPVAVFRYGVVQAGKGGSGVPSLAQTERTVRLSWGRGPYACPVVPYSEYGHFVPYLSLPASSFLVPLRAHLKSYSLAAITVRWKWWGKQVGCRPHGRDKGTRRGDLRSIGLSTRLCTSRLLETPSKG